MEWITTSWEAVQEWLYSTWSIIIELVRSFKVTDAIDVILVSFIIYSAIKLLRETRAGQLVKGLLIILAVWLLSSYFQLYMLKSLFSYFFQFSMIALLVVFQPEIRRALEQLGRTEIGKGLAAKGWFAGSAKTEEELLRQQVRKGINAVVDVAASFQKSKTGALIVFERQTKLGEIIDTGTVVDAEPSPPIIGNIFWNKAPLHDGAMVMRAGKVYAAGCILPLTKNDSVSIELGTRHRAAIGLSEVSDAVIVVVSEETGQISMAVNGLLTRDYTRETLRSELQNLLLPVEQDAGEHRSSKIPSIRRARKR